MSDHDDDDGHRELVSRMRSEMNAMLAPLMSNMMEQMVSVQTMADVVKGEAEAWDKYFASAYQRPNATMANAIMAADEALSERRNRFSAQKIQERILMSMPSSEGACGKTTTSGSSCTRTANHEPPCV